MNVNLLRQSAGDQVRRLAIFSIGLILFALLIAASLPTFTTGTDASLINQIFQAMPREFAPLVGGDPARLVSPNGYLGVAYSHPLVLVLFSAYTISLASGALAGEIDRGTMRLLMARPLRRRALVLGRALVMLVCTLGLAGTLWLGTALAVAWFKVGVDLDRFAWAALSVFALFAAIGGVSCLLSAASSSAGRAAGLAGGLTLALYFLDYLAQIWEPLAPWGTLSLFHYHRPVEITFRGQVPWGDLALLFSIAALAIALAAIVFERRDIAG